ncbi:MAG: hypothetical protein ACR2H1_09035 [Limisphaerales bacterium]
MSTLLSRNSFLNLYSGSMVKGKITSALKNISAEKDATLKSQKMASLCSALFLERGIELVVVGGSAIEFYTEGAYASGDLDLCYSNLSKPLSLRLRQEIMGQLGAEGGPRSWQVAGIFVDILGPIETLARTPFRELDAPFGPVKMAQQEELLVERTLISVYPGPNEAALNCAKKFLSLALSEELRMDWNEVKRLADRPEYRILPECKKLVKKVADELKIKSPFDSN